MTKRLIPATLLAVALFAAACSSGSSSTSKSTTTSTTAVPTTTTKAVTTTTAMAVCSTKNLAISLGGSQGAAGTIYQIILFKNVSTSLCTMGGFPGVDITVTGGSPIQVPRNTATPKTIVLPANSYASANLAGGDVPEGSATTCPTASALMVTPPNETQSQTLASKFSGTCGNLSIAPVVLGENGTQN